MKIQWHDGGVLFRPTSTHEHNALIKLYRAMDGLDADGIPRDLYITSEDLKRDWDAETTDTDPFEVKG